MNHILSETTIRPGTKEDLPSVFDLIVELAVYEKAPDEVVNTLEEMKEDGFGKCPVFKFLVAEYHQKIIGISIYYARYSTWKGRVLFLEDLIVTEAFRGKGIGHLLFEATSKIAMDENYKAMNWQVLDWNEPALNFYKKYNSTITEGWLNGKLTTDQIRAFLNIERTI